MPTSFVGIDNTNGKGEKVSSDWGRLPPVSKGARVGQQGVAGTPMWVSREKLSVADGNFFFLFCMMVNVYSVIQAGTRIVCAGDFLLWRQLFFGAGCSFFSLSVYF